MCNRKHVFGINFVFLGFFEFDSRLNLDYLIKHIYFSYYVYRKTNIQASGAHVKKPVLDKKNINLLIFVYQS